MSERTIARIAAGAFMVLFPILGAVSSYVLQDNFFGAPFIYGTIFGLVFGSLQLVFPVTRSQAQEQRARRKMDRDKDRGKYGLPTSVILLLISLLVFAMVVLTLFFIT